ncbi:MAG: hypothetical protein M3R59_06920 [Verrucomicrobiota bacterium]|nr:hypothetical protein [Verrucomicrobiota bacterium]
MNAATDEMPRSLQRWESLRQKGKRKFIVQNGLLAWGLPMFIFMTFVFGRSQKYPLTPTLILLHASIWALAGVGYGWIVWTFTEKKYQEFVRRRNGET